MMQGGSVLSQNPRQKPIHTCRPPLNTYIHAVWFLFSLSFLFSFFIVFLGLLFSSFLAWWVGWWWLFFAFWHSSPLLMLYSRWFSLHPSFTLFALALLFFWWCSSSIFREIWCSFVKDKRGGDGGTGIYWGRVLVQFKVEIVEGFCWELFWFQYQYRLSWFVYYFRRNSKFAIQEIFNKIHMVCILTTFLLLVKKNMTPLKKKKI